MLKQYKWVMLSLLMALPIFIFLFLHLFGENHYKVPTFYPEDVTERELNGKTVYDTTFFTLPSFELTNQYSEKVSTEGLKGKILVSDFIFTRCMGPCPKMTTQLTRVQEAFKNRKDIVILSHSVDPGYDSIPVLKAFADRFGAEKGRWHFLSGNREQIKSLCGPVGYKLALNLGDGDSETIDHSNKLVLVDMERHIRGYYTGTDEKDVDRLILEIKILLHEYGE